ncbi:UNVERIFIED_CONTAM: F-box protein [Sesamum latifolium]|uniref:F-box protein n=1 Tax=Sesamum latifolium TaxID=2727402 RepID=A0AAW2XY80_9LAMI
MSLFSISSVKLLNDESFFLDETTGKKCCIVGARDLKISQADRPQNWNWRFDADSRFSEVAELRSALRLDIREKIKARMLQPRTVYAACLVFKIVEEAAGLQSAKAMIRFVNDESDRDAAKRARPVYLQLVKDTKGGNVVERADGWTEVEMGNFYIGQGDDGEVEARLLEFRRWKTGLVVEGVVFRPTFTYTETPLVSKKYMLTKVWG